jgi:hypothetical protein
MYGKFFLKVFPEKILSRKIFGKISLDFFAGRFSAGKNFAARKYFAEGVRGSHNIC